MFYNELYGWDLKIPYFLDFFTKFFSIRGQLLINIIVSCYFSNGIYLLFIISKGEIMNEGIKALIKEEKYNEALKKIDELLNDRQFNLEDEKDENEYSELLHQRITVNTLTGVKDEIVSDIIKKERHPSKIEYPFDGQNSIVLRFTSQFLLTCDAYVSSINPETLFEGSGGAGPRGEFIKRVGAEEIKAQLKNYKDLKEGDIFVLRHPQLSAPYSYHIVFDHENYTDIKNLAKGIKRVIDDACRRNFKLLIFFPLGFGSSYRVPKENQDKAGSEIASSSVEPIVDYFFMNNKKSIPTIYFTFISTDSMFAYDKVVYSYSKLKKNIFILMKGISKREKNLINDSITLDPDYIETLKEITYSLDDDSTILLLGETGVGKSYLAKIIHDNSIKASGPFEKMNCAMLKPNWLYVEVFGCTKGAYTDSKEDREGAIGRAEGGTLFLDEIGHTDLDVQKMLLQFLDDGTYRRLGDKVKVERQADVRVMLGTNADLESLIVSKEFLPDLYERISGRQFVLPPLRDRKDDIIHFSEYILEKLNSSKSFDIKLSEEAKELLRNYNWPGNIRQLKSYLESLHVKSYHLKQPVISAEIIQNKPPRDNLYRVSNPFLQLESSLQSFIKNWDSNDGKLREELVEPMLAKIFLDELKMNKTDSSKIIGLDGTGGSDSTLMKRYRKYKESKVKFDS